MWTLQELALGREVLVLCGNLTITWWALAFGVQCLRDGLHTQTSLTAVEDDLVGSILHHNMLRWAVLTETGLGELGGQPLNRSLSCSEVFVYAASKKATDPKDKIFALYGLFQALHMGMPKPDYSKPLNEIYTEATRAAIEHDRDPHILDHIVMCGHMENAPSWVPNWNGQPMGTMSIRPFQAANTSTARYRLSADGKQLTLSGIRVDCINKRANPVHYPGGFEASVKKDLNVFEIFKSMKEWYYFMQHLNPYRTGEADIDVYFRTLILDGAQLKDNARDLERFRHSFKQWYSLVMLCKTTNEKPPTQGILGYLSNIDPEQGLKLSNAATFFHCQVMWLLVGKVLFITQTGYMGTAPEMTQVDDIVVLFAGMKVPHVLRKKGNSYGYVGPAYVHGLMDGEAWKEDPTSLEEFTLV
jgi:hypothetical protein